MLTQIDVVYDGMIAAWSSTVNYEIGRRVTSGGSTWEAVAPSTNVPPSGPTSQWVSLGTTGAIGTPVTEEAALALPILGVTPKDSLLIRKVTGLNPPDADLFIGDYARDGGIYQGRRVGTRNVVMTIDLNPNPALGETISGLRDLLYKTFMDPLVDADHIELVLRSDDGRVRNIHGYTERFETEIFDVETLAQISVICPDPYVRDLEETVLTNATGTWVTVPFTYGGSAETGFKVTLNVSSDTTTVTLMNNGQNMVINHAFLNGDVVDINTIRGERNVTYTRGGTTYPLISKLTTTSKWIEIHSVANTLTVYGATSSNIVAGIKTLQYRASYWGV